MATFSAFDWLTVIGLGMAWLGWQIVIVGGPPRFVRPSTNEPRVQRGTPEAFQRFWIEQYRYIGVVLGIAGLALAAAGALS